MFLGSTKLVNLFEARAAKFLTLPQMSLVVIFHHAGRGGTGGIGGRGGTGGLGGFGGTGLGGTLGGVLGLGTPARPMLVTKTLVTPNPANVPAPRTPPVSSLPEDGTTVL